MPVPSCRLCVALSLLFTCGLIHGAVHSLIPLNQELAFYSQSQGEVSDNTETASALNHLELKTFSENNHLWSLAIENSNEQGSEHLNTDTFSPAETGGMIELDFASPVSSYQWPVSEAE